jgi:hypothetical protein
VQGGDAGDNAGANLPALTKEEAVALCYLANKHPVGASLENIGDGAQPTMSKATAKAAVDRLISLNYATRPNGPNKGVVATDAGLAVANKVRTKLAPT